MEIADFVFKKQRKLGELISNYIALFRMMFKHFFKNILTVALPFIAVFVLISFYFINFIISDFTRTAEPSTELIFSIAGMGMLFGLSFFLVVSTFVVEYMFLLQEKMSFDFTYKMVFSNIKKNFLKYIKFFFASILVSLIVAIPLVFISIILAFIPLIGQIALGILGSMIALYMYAALFLYIQGRSSLSSSFTDSFALIRKKIFEYGLANYLFQMMLGIIIAFIIFIPAIIIFIISFNSIGFDDFEFFQTFVGKLLIAIGSSIIFLFVIFTTMCRISFGVLQYFSLLEITYSEETIDEIEQIGKTGDEF